MNSFLASLFFFFLFTFKVSVLLCLLYYLSPISRLSKAWSDTSYLIEIGNVVLNKFVISLFNYLTHRVFNDYRPLQIGLIILRSIKVYFTIKWRSYK